METRLVITEQYLKKSTWRDIHDTGIGTSKVYTWKLNKWLSSELIDGERREYRPKRCDNNIKVEYNSNVDSLNKSVFSFCSLQFRFNCFNDYGCLFFNNAKKIKSQEPIKVEDY